MSCPDRGEHLRHGAALQSAINVAAPGDILDVMPAGYSAATCSKGIRISPRAGAEVGYWVSFPIPLLITGVPVPSLAITHTATAINVTLAGKAGSAWLTFGGLPGPTYATPWGDGWLLPTDPILDVTILPATGTASFARTFGAVPTDFVLVVQSIALRPNGELVVGAPVRFAWN